MVRNLAVLAVLSISFTLLTAGCQCGFDNSALTALACTTGADCAPDQDCIEGTCVQRACGAPTDCGTDYAYGCDDQGFCVAAGCTAPEDCEPGLVCEGGFCRVGSSADGGGGNDASVLPDASVPDASDLDASVPPDGSILPDASVSCRIDDDCDDGVFCNGRETCAGGSCAAGGSPCPPSNPCATTACDEQALICRTDFRPDAEPCDDGNACSYGDACLGGACAASPYSCDDGLVCTADACDGLGGCSNARDPATCVIEGVCRQTGETTADGCGECAPDVDPLRWTVDCGACPNSCSALEQCVDGRCVEARFGSSADGDFAVPPGETVSIGALATAVTGAAGHSTLDLANPEGFAAGQVVLVHQTQGTGAGSWELARIAGLVGGSATLAEALRHEYVSSDSDHAQAVVVPEYGNLTVDGTLTAPAWNGTTGGILALLASGTVTVTGTIDMAGRGFRGTAHACVYQCATGYQGESSIGPGVVERVANGHGGGAGTGGQDCGMGGGGGHGTAGGGGADGSPIGGCGLTPLGGIGGDIVGTADLDEGMFFGGAGGEGGADEDGANPGAGGNGGGIVVLYASSIVVTGAVTANGLRGADGVSLACGAGGCGMGGGGGGAGGAIRIVASTADLGVGLVQAVGGESGLCTCGAGLTGIGGVGRIETTATVLNGTTNPA